jgi:hypothetical protein
MTISIHNIAIPVDTGDEYCTPEMQKAMDYYPQYAAHCLRNGITPWKRRPYLLLVCKELAKTGITRDGREYTKDDVLRRVLEHFGLLQMEKWFNEEIPGTCTCGEDDDTNPDTSLPHKTWCPKAGE